jgi:hypothetical protein
MPLGVYSPSNPARKIARSPVNTNRILIGLDWLPSKTFGPFHLITDARRMSEHQDSAKKRDQPTGTHGGLPKGDVAQTANGPTSRLIVGGVSTLGT